MTLEKVILWLIIGAVAGTLAGRLVTFSKKGLGFWTHLLIGIAGAVVGGILFWLLRIDLGLAEFKVDGNEVVSAFIGSLLCILAWRFYRRSAEAAADKDPLSSSPSDTPSV